MALRRTHSLNCLCLFSQVLIKVKHRMCVICSNVDARSTLQTLIEIWKGTGSKRKERNATNEFHSLQRFSIETFIFLATHQVIDQTTKTITPNDCHQINISAQNK